MTAALPPPSADAQLTFLTKLQRLLSEGDFTATYKFALLIALADLAVERGSDDGGELVLGIRQLAERFIDLYWRHVAPYGAGQSGSAEGILVQNSGAQAAVLTAIEEFRGRTGAANPQQVRDTEDFDSLLSRVAATVSAQPLKYLQNFGGTTDRFIYEKAGRGAIVLKPGVTYCLRRFYPLVQQLARAHWVNHIRANRRNKSLLGDASNLEEFLFSASRQSLALVGLSLRKLDGNRCFYCGHRLDDAEVDHYIPFALYPRDLAHNFVLAHPGCNRSKSDTLAALPHLDRWLERLHKRAGDLTEIGLHAGISADPLAVTKVARWSYVNAVASGAQAWLSPSRYEPLGLECLSRFQL